MEHDFEIVHRADVKHQADDALSKLSTSGLENTELEDKGGVIEVDQTKNHHKRNYIVRSHAQMKNLLPKSADKHYVELPTFSELSIAQSENVFLNNLFK